MHNPDRRRWRAEGRASWERTRDSLKRAYVVSIVTSLERNSRPYIFRGPGSIPHAVEGLAQKLLGAPRV